MRWSTVAGLAGMAVYAETQWESVVDALRVSGGTPPWEEEPRLGSCPPEVLLSLRGCLAEHTTTPDLVWYGLWVGFPDVMAVARSAPRFELPGREYILLKGPLSAADTIISSPYDLRTGPSLWWPDDRAWCVATEIDFRWTYVGGTEPCIEHLERDARLEVLRTQPTHRGDIESDWSEDVILP